MFICFGEVGKSIVNKWLAFIYLFKKLSRFANERVFGQKKTSALLFIERDVICSIQKLNRKHSVIQSSLSFQSLSIGQHMRSAFRRNAGTRQFSWHLIWETLGMSFFGSVLISSLRNPLHMHNDIFNDSCSRESFPARFVNWMPNGAVLFVCNRFDKARQSANF